MKTLLMDYSGYPDRFGLKSTFNLTTFSGVSAQHLRQPSGVNPSTVGEIGEIMANVALNIFTDYFNLTTRTDIDFPKVKIGAGVAYFTFPPENHDCRGLLLVRLKKPSQPKFGSWGDQSKWRATFTRADANTSKQKYRDV